MVQADRAARAGAISRGHRNIDQISKAIQDQGKLRDTSRHKTSKELKYAF
jgi:hypothetical protein